MFIPLKMVLILIHTHMRNVDITCEKWSTNTAWDLISQVLGELLLAAFPKRVMGNGHKWVDMSIPAQISYAIGMWRWWDVKKYPTPKSMHTCWPVTTFQLQMDLLRPPRWIPMSFHGDGCTWISPWTTRESHYQQPSLRNSKNMTTLISHHLVWLVISIPVIKKIVNYTHHPKYSWK